MAPIRCSNTIKLMQIIRYRLLNSPIENLSRQRHTQNNTITKAYTIYSRSIWKHRLCIVNDRTRLDNKALQTNLTKLIEFRLLLMQLYGIHPTIITEWRLDIRFRRTMIFSLIVPNTNTNTTPMPVYTQPVPAEIRITWEKNGCRVRLSTENIVAYLPVHVRSNVLMCVCVWVCLWLSLSVVPCLSILFIRLFDWVHLHYRPF